MSVDDLSVSDIADILKEIDLYKYSNCIVEHKISGKVLPLLKEEHIKEIGISIVGHRLKFLKLVNRLTKKGYFDKKKNIDESKISTKVEITPTKDKSLLLGGGKTIGTKDNRVSLPKESEKSKNIVPMNLKNKIPKKNQPEELKEDDNYEGRSRCSHCGRFFASDRIDKHESVCSKSKSKKTKVFDSKKMRVEGTDAAQFALKPTKEPEIAKTINGIPKYRLEHENLINTMRAARKMAKYQQDVEEGKNVAPPELPKIIELPDDRMQCKFCGRKFSSEAISRHESTCERMKSRSQYKKK